MPHDDLLKLRNQKLASTFDEKPYDPAKDRKKYQATLQKAFDDYSSATPTKGRKPYKVNHKGEVRLKTPFEVGGDTEHHFDNGGKFTEFLAHLTQLVGKGEFDDALAAIKNRVTGTDTPTKPRGKRGPLSPEKLAARRAKMAAKGTAKK